MAQQKSLLLKNGRNRRCYCAALIARYHESSYTNVRVAKEGSPKTVPKPQLTVVTAEKVFGWKNVHQQDGVRIGKKQDKAGRWRSAKVPDYSNDAVHAYAIDERMKQLGRWDAYVKELAGMTKAQGLPLDWATPEQRSRAATKVAGSKRRK